MSDSEFYTSKLGAMVIDTIEHCGQTTIEVAPANLIEALNFLRTDADGGFDFLVDVVGLDNAPDEPRFEVLYLLCNSRTRKRLRVKVRIAEEAAELPSVTSIWRSADWAEREVYDMFGVTFTGHHNLKRILTWDEFPDYPLRKDYPLKGKGEERVLTY